MIAHKDVGRRTGRGSGTRYSTTCREAALAAVEEGLGAGRSLTSLAAEMDLPLHTIRRWLARQRSGFRPVQIAAADASTPHASGVVLFTAHGHRIEGLDLAGLVAVLRALELPA